MGDTTLTPHPSELTRAHHQAPVSGLQMGEATLTTQHSDYGILPTVIYLQ